MHHCEACSGTRSPLAGYDFIFEVMKVNACLGQFLTTFFCQKGLKTIRIRSNILVDVKFSLKRDPLLEIVYILILKLGKKCPPVIAKFFLIEYVNVYLKPLERCGMVCGHIKNNLPLQNV